MQKLHGTERKVLCVPAPLAWHTADEGHGHPVPISQASTCHSLDNASSYLATVGHPCNLSPTSCANFGAGSPRLFCLDRALQCQGSVFGRRRVAGKVGKRLWRGRPWLGGLSGQSGGRKPIQSGSRETHPAGRGGVAGDQVAHVEWRLMNGEMPIRTGPRAFVLMIGTNDLGAASCYPGEAPLLQAVPGVTARSAPSAISSAQAVVERVVSHFFTPQPQECVPNSLAKEDFSKIRGYQNSGASRLCLTCGNRNFGKFR